ncbi:hypothetical protein PMAYCL1PPCAC_23585 [Pristionchus mayeri]|uniref:Chromatin modification-related protein MEAF6 n=1 Tax=Pristionchus mayeri TaxID=1317129 RepID=A0AAN5CZP6_9BILA|nr:hypothetical protein PMAYCL1PPCAC_23585 [Pristionchus mayeri]
MTKDQQEIRKELTALIERRQTLQEALGQLETQIYNFETTYLDETSEYGNIFKGWNRYALAAPLSKTTAIKLEKKSNKKGVKDSDRLFSSSSVSSPLSRRQSSAVHGVNGNGPSTSRIPSVGNGGTDPADGPTTSNTYIKEEEIYDDEIPRKKKRRE